MGKPDRTINLPTKDLLGSRFRCLLFTHQPDTVVAKLLNDLVYPHAVVDANVDHW